MLSNYVSVIDREILTKKDILLKGVSFYFRSLFFLASTILLLIFILNLLHVDTSFLKYPIEAERNELIERGVFQAMLLVVFFAPLIEELSFRLGISFKKRDLFISSVAFAYMMGALFFMDGYFDKIHITIPLAFITGAIIYRLSQYFIETKEVSSSNLPFGFQFCCLGFCMLQTMILHLFH